MQFTDWKKIFAKRIAHKGLMSRRDKELFSFQPNLFKWSKDLNRLMTLNQRKYRNIK